MNIFQINHHISLNASFISLIYEFNHTLIQSLVLLVYTECTATTGMIQQIEVANAYPQTIVMKKIGNYGNHTACNYSLAKLLYLYLDMDKLT